MRFSRKVLRARKLQEIVDENNKHLRIGRLWMMAGKDERKKLRSKENTLPLELFNDG